MTSSCRRNATPCNSATRHIRELITTLGAAPGQNLSTFKTAEPVTGQFGRVHGPGATSDARILLFGGLALLLGLVAALVIERFDPRMRTGPRWNSDSGCRRSRRTLNSG